MFQLIKALAKYVLILAEYWKIAKKLKDANLNSINIATSLGLMIYHHQKFLAISILAYKTWQTQQICATI